MYYIPLSPHNICGPIGTMAACHVCAAVPNFQVLEFHHLDNELWQALTLERDLIDNGHLAVPTRPGLGVALDEDAARRATRENLGFFE
jgi:L-alanine-DL-glutamate epimerase-like enolase superfamily enzyme